LSYYDKEKKERITVKLPFKFLVLDQLSTVSGYNSKLKTGIFANEVKDQDGILTVKMFNGEDVAKGTWSAIKDTVTSKRIGGSFAKSIYIAFKGDDGKLTIGNIKASGCALSPWFEFTSKVKKDVEKKAVILTQGEVNKEGIEFTPPEFSLCETTQETDDAAKALDVTLQEFLLTYLFRQGTPHAASEPEYSDTEAMPTYTGSEEPQDERQPLPDWTQGKRKVRPPAEPADNERQEMAEDDIPF